MSIRDVVKAELNIGQKPSEKSSWPAATSDVIAVAYGMLIRAIDGHTPSVR